MIKKKVYSLYKKSTQKLISGSRSFYYKFFYGRHFPFAASLENTISKWEQKYHLGETVKHAQAWDEEYKSEKWDYLMDLDELPRYSLLAGYMAYLKPGGSFLDIGCGDGILFEKYRPYGFSFYKGIDVSEIAIQELAEKHIKNTEFIAEDAEYYQPQERFDAIIFNESLYYFKDPIAVIERYTPSLKKNGIVITSMFEGASRSRSVNRSLQSHYPLLDKSQCSNNSKTWVCLVFNPRDK